MTEGQAQAASSPFAAEQLDAASAHSAHADAVSMTSSKAVQQEQCEGALQAAEVVNTAEGSGQDRFKDSALVDAEVLIIEDAAQLTCDRAAVILRQLSYECQAAVDYAYNSLDTPLDSLAADNAQLPAYDMQHLESDLQAKACHINATSADCAAAAVADEVGVPGRAQMQDIDLNCPHARMAGWSLQISTPGNATDVTGWQADQHGILPSHFAPAGTGQAAVSLQHPTAGLDTASSTVPGRDAGHTVEQLELAQAVSQSAVSASQSTSKQGSSFLKRLQMSKHASVSGCDAAPHQPEDTRPGDS